MGKRPYVIGLTGNIATGKSVVGRTLSRLGAEHIDADRLAHQVMAPGTPACKEIAAAFGAQVLQPDGAIDRRRLGAIVFSDPEALSRLEAIVHPHVIARTRQRIATSSAPEVVIEAIKLFESGMVRSLCDAVWVVTAPREAQIRRLTEGRGLSYDEAVLRVDAQPPQEEKAARADVVIANGGPLEALTRQVERAWAEIGRGDLAQVQTSDGKRERTMDVTIRRGTVRDAQGVVDVINSVIEEGGLTALYPTLTVEQEEAYIQGLGPRSALYIAEVRGMTVGVQSIEPFDAYTRATDHVASIGTFIYRNYRGQGTGRRLTQEIVRFAREHGYEKIVFFIRASNSGAQAFYRRMGFVPKMMLERQIKIEGRYDDVVWMEMFVTPEVKAPAAPPVSQAVPEVPPAAAAVSSARAVPAVDPTVGAVTVRRARRGDIHVLAAIMKGTMRWRSPPAEQEVLEMLFDKGYWLAISRQGGGLTGWRAENLVMCIDDFCVYPSRYYAEVGGPLLETVETEAKALSCEVAIAFLEAEIAPEAIRFFESQGYERQEVRQLFSVWREVAQEFLSDGRFMMVKKLRERRVMRPL
ncbi:MAG: dephospho-CoA kinase [Anaerolineae bacterium]|nr:dephospho-CoA kinase [Anaerolineae bacterium]